MTCQDEDNELKLCLGHVASSQADVPYVHRKQVSTEEAVDARAGSQGRGVPNKLEEGWNCFSISAQEGEGESLCPSLQI